MQTIQKEFIFKKLNRRIVTNCFCNFPFQYFTFQRDHFSVVSHNVGITRCRLKAKKNHRNVNGDRIMLAASINGQLKINFEHRTDHAQAIYIVQYSK